MSIVQWSSDYGNYVPPFVDVVDQAFSDMIISTDIGGSLWLLHLHSIDNQRKIISISSWRRRSEWGSILDRVRITQIWHVWVPRPIHCWCIGWLWFVREGVTGGSHRWEATQDCEKIFLAQLRRWTYQFVVHPRNNPSLNLDQWNASKWYLGIVVIGTEPWKKLLNQVESDTKSSAVSSFVSWFPIGILCSVRWC